MPAEKSLTKRWRHTSAQRLRLSAVECPGTASRRRNWMDAAEYLGYKVVLVDADTEELAEFPGNLPALVFGNRLMAWCTTQPRPSRYATQTQTTAGGWEVFEADSGQFFVAHYTTWDGVGNFITLCPAEEAKNLSGHLRSLKGGPRERAFSFALYYRMVNNREKLQKRKKKTLPFGPVFTIIIM